MGPLAVSSSNSLFLFSHCYSRGPQGGSSNRTPPRANFGPPSPGSSCPSVPCCMSGTAVYRVAQVPDLRAIQDLPPLTSYDQHSLSIYERPRYKCPKMVQGLGQTWGPWEGQAGFRPAQASFSSPWKSIIVGRQPLPKLGLCAVVLPGSSGKSFILFWDHRKSPCVRTC